MIMSILPCSSHLEMIIFHLEDFCTTGTTQVCSKSLETNQSTGGEKGIGTTVGEEMVDEFDTCALCLSTLTHGPKKYSRGNIAAVIFAVQ